MLKEHSKIHKVNQETYAIAIRELMDGPTTPQELAAVSGMHLVTMQNLMRTFLRHKIVDLVGWEPNARGADSTPVYRIGSGKRVKRRCLTQSERTKSYRERKKMREMTNIVSTGVNHAKGTEAATV